MLLIVATELDAGALAAASSWNGPAAVCTPADLSLPGWSAEVGNVAAATVVAGSNRIAMRDITGIVNALPGLAPQQLFRVEEEDRMYAAIEATAFLSWLLAFAPCPVTNRATAASLHGPGWGDERWNLEAQRCGLLDGLGEGVLAVVGDTVLGDFSTDDARDVACGMRRLARVARISYLRIHVERADNSDGAVIRRVDVVPDLANDEVVRALQSFLRPAPAAGRSR